MANLNFNANEVEPSSGDFTPVPAGWYAVTIIESEMKETKAGNGHYLELVTKVFEGEHINRQFYIRLNVDNPNEVAVRIAQEQLSAICHAVNVMQVQDSQQLHGIPFEIKVAVKAANENYEASNEVKGFRATEGTSKQSTASPSWADKKEAPTKKAPPAKKAEKKLEMIDSDFSYEEWLETGRTDQEMVDEGIAKWVEAAPSKKAPPAKKAPPNKGSAADGGSTGQSSAAGVGEELPPWMK